MVVWAPSLRTHWTVSPAVIVTVAGENPKFSAPMVTVLPPTGTVVAVTGTVVAVAGTVVAVTAVVVVVAVPAVVVVARVVVVAAAVVVVLPAVVSVVVDMSASSRVVVVAAVVDVPVADTPAVVEVVPPATPPQAARTKVNPSKLMSQCFMTTHYASSEVQGSQH